MTTRSEGSKDFFRAVNPQVLLHKQSLIRDDLKQALPSLLSLNPDYLTTPNMTVHIGKSGLKTMWEDMLSAEGHIYYITDNSLTRGTDVDEDQILFTPEESHSDEYVSEYVRKRVEKGIWIHSIVPYEQNPSKLQAKWQNHFLNHKKHGAAQLRDFYFVPKEKFPFDNEISIYNNKVAIISYHGEAGVILESQTFASTLKSVFNLAFEFARTLENEILTEKDKLFLQEP